jgi:hypothetical protein
MRLAEALPAGAPRAAIRTGFAALRESPLHPGRSP